MPRYDVLVEILIDAEKAEDAEAQIINHFGAGKVHVIESATVNDSPEEEVKDNCCHQDCCTTEGPY